MDLSGVSTGSEWLEFLFFSRSCWGGSTGRYFTTSFFTSWTSDHGMSGEHWMSQTRPASVVHTEPAAHTTLAAAYHIHQPDRTWAKECTPAKQASNTGYTWSSTCRETHSGAAYLLFNHPILFSFSLAHHPQERSNVLSWLSLSF